jgi:hypothetical protein
MSIISNFYKFVDSPDLYLIERNNEISYFISENIIVAIRIICLVINEEEMKSVIDKNTLEKSYNILSDVLYKKLKELNTEDLKIQICKIKLKDILILIYKFYKNENKEKNEKKLKMEDEKVQLCDKYRNEISWNGYSSDIMKSGLQKYIRRGNLDKALYCAGELDLFKEAQDRGETIRTNFLHRLMITYMEDVENMSIFNEVDKLIEKLFREREKKDRNKSLEEEWISRLVYLMTFSEKARVCSHIRAVFNPKYNNQKLLNKYPSIKELWQEIDNNKSKTLESHCKFFKKYFNEKSILCIYYAFQIDLSEEKLKTKYFRSNKSVWFIFNELLKYTENKDRINKFVEWYKNHIGKMKEGFLCWLFPLLYEISIIPNRDKDLEYSKYCQKYSKNWDRNRSMEKIEIDDYILDRHTKMGRRKGLVEFALIGAFVENEASFVNQLWKKFYEDGKRFEDNQDIIGEDIQYNQDIMDNQDIIGEDNKDINEDEDEEKIIKENKEENIPLETDEYKFIVLTQLVTSGSKMDVYFAKDKDDELVVVKGPYQNKKQINILIKNTECKKKNNLPYIPFKVIQLIPNRWSEGIPLGARNNIDRKNPAWFIIFDSVIKESQIKIKVHSSKLWPETKVVDWDKVSGIHFEYKSGNRTDKEIKDYVEAILYRYMRGISDLADRNFLMVNSRVISIDEDIEGHPVKIFTELRKNKSEFIYNWIKSHYEELGINHWKLCDISDEKRLLEIQDRNKCLRLFKE